MIKFLLTKIFPTKTSLQIFFECTIIMLGRFDKIKLDKEKLIFVIDTVNGFILWIIELSSRDEIIRKIFIEELRSCLLPYSKKFVVR